MQQLFPTCRDGVEPGDVYSAVVRRPHTDRPYVVMNMIESLDGTIAVDGLSGGLGGPADKRVFAAIRAVADMILVGAATVRAEGYGPARLNDALREARRARGQADVPGIAVVSASLDLDYTTPLFAESRPLVLTGAHADPTRRAAAEAHADVVSAGTEGVEPAVALAVLRDRGTDVVLCEGGPSLNGQMVAAGMIDEVCVTVAPFLLGGDGPRISGGKPLPVTRLAINHVLEEDGYVFLDYVVAR